MDPVEIIEGSLTYKVARRGGFDPTRQTSLCKLWWQLVLGILWYLAVGVIWAFLVFFWVQVFVVIGGWMAEVTRACLLQDCPNPSPNLQVKIAFAVVILSALALALVAALLIWLSRNKTTTVSATKENPPKQDWVFLQAFRAWRNKYCAPIKVVSKERAVAVARARSGMTAESTRRYRDAAYSKILGSSEVPGPSRRSESPKGYPKRPENL